MNTTIGSQSNAWNFSGKKQSIRNVSLFPPVFTEGEYLFQHFPLEYRQQTKLSCFKNTTVACIWSYTKLLVIKMRGLQQIRAVPVTQGSQVDVFDEVLTGSISQRIETCFTFSTHSLSSTLLVLKPTTASLIRHNSAEFSFHLLECFCIFSPEQNSFVINALHSQVIFPTSKRRKNKANMNLHQLLV